MLKLLPHLPLLLKIVDAFESLKASGTGLELRPSYRGNKFVVNIRRVS